MTVPFDGGAWFVTFTHEQRKDTVQGAVFYGTFQEDVLKELGDDYEFITPLTITALMDAPLGTPIQEVVQGNAWEMKG